MTSEGLRIYGGHSARVSGSQDLASAGVEVAKIRIFARHSGDAILHYVADAPLAAIRSDLGLSKAKPATKGLQEVSTKKLQTQLERLSTLVNEQKGAMRALAIVAVRIMPSSMYRT